VKNSAVRQSTLVLLVLLAVGIGKSFARQTSAAPHPIAQRPVAADQTGGDPEPPPPCCNLVAVH